MDPFKTLEVTGVVFWLVYLLLLVRENIWCWIFGIMASIITVVMFYHSKIYMEALLNVYYVGVGCYGWYYWATARKGKGSAPDKEKAPVARWTWQLHLVTFMAAAAAGMGLGLLLMHQTDSPRPFLDASLASFSFLATIMQARKVFTCWLYWMVVNCCLVGLQIDRGIYFYAALSAFYAVMSILGFLRWRRSYLMQQVETIKIK